MRTLLVIALIFSALIVVEASLLTTHTLRGNPLVTEWANFKKTYSKSYATSVEETHRFGIFVKNMQRVDQLNKENIANGHGPAFGVTQFSDLTHEEFAGTHFGYEAATMEDRATGLNGSPMTIKEQQIADGGMAATFQWPLADVGAIENQEDCGGCWAFSTSQVVASQTVFQLNSAYLELSPQQILDCDKTDSGCDGGDTVTAYAYIIKAGGLESWANYPFIDGDGTCHFTPSKVAVSFNQWEYVMNNCGSNCERSDFNVTELQAKLQARGPLSICVDAEPWQFYNGGILSSGCPGSPTDLDHCVLLTGWGTSSSGTLYWNIKNQWGASWGINGYIHVLASSANVCGIMDEVTRPLNIRLASK